MSLLRKIEFYLRRFRMIVIFTLVAVFFIAMRFSGDAEYFRYVLESIEDRDGIRDGRMIEYYNRLDTTLRILASQRYADVMINNNEFRRLYETDSLLNQKINFYGRLARTNASNIEKIKQELNKGVPNNEKISSDQPKQPIPVERSLQIAKGETILMREWFIAH